jgi:LuxR family maltose regulon positive regulatory protein
MVEQLTARELEILTLLAAGAPNPRIAEQLVVSLDTVKKHVSHVLGKLGAANRTEAVTRARQLGLIPNSPLPCTDPEPWAWPVTCGLAG